MDLGVGGSSPLGHPLFLSSQVAPNETKPTQNTEISKVGMVQVLISEVCQSKPSNDLKCSLSRQVSAKGKSAVNADDSGTGTEVTHISSSAAPTNAPASQSVTFLASAAISPATVSDTHGIALPADLVELAALWPSLPDAVKQGWLATARALAAASNPPRLQYQGAHDEHR